MAFRVAETRRTDAPMVVLSTASPFKFPRDVLTALGGEAPASELCRYGRADRRDRCRGSRLAA